MLDSTTFRAQIDAAIESFSAALADLYAAELKRREAAAPQTRPEAKQTAARPVSKPKKVEKPAKAPKAAKGKKTTKPEAQRPRPLLLRANVHLVPSGTKTVPTPVTTPSPVEPLHKGPPPEEIAQKAERMVLAASLPPTFERIRRALRVSKAALTPVIDELVESKKIVMVDVGDVVLYKPPRIEPIRRRRQDRTASNSPRV